VKGYEILEPIKHDNEYLEPGDRIELKELDEDDASALIDQGVIRLTEWLGEQKEAEDDQHQSDVSNMPKQTGNAPAPASVSAEHPKEAASGSAKELEKPEDGQDQSDSSNMPESQGALNTLEQASNTSELVEAPTGQSTEAASDPASKKSGKK